MIFDLLGSCISLISTILFIRVDIRAWPTGLLAIAINGSLYWYKGIYGDMTLEIIYMVFLCYGWSRWHKAQISSKVEIQIKTLNQQQMLLLICLAGFLFYGIYYVLTEFTDSNVPTLDALATALSLIAQGLMCYKIITTWVLWFITDSIYAWMYFGKELPFHVLLMIVYTGMAIQGHRHWSKLKKKVVRKIETIDILLDGVQKP